MNKYSSQEEKINEIELHPLDKNFQIKKNTNKFMKKHNEL